MIRFMMRRLMVTIPLLFIVSFMTMVLMHLIPGNYFDQLRMNPGIGEDVIQRIESTFHVNDSLFVQYWYWLRGIMRLDFGYSFTYHMPVTQILYSRLLNTIVLSFSALLFAWSLAVPLGVYAAYKKDTWIDRCLNMLSYMVLSIPSYFAAVLLVYICAEYTSLPLGGMRSAHYEMLSYAGKVSDRLLHMLVPVGILGVFTASALYRVVRTNVLEVIHKDFVRILYTRGFSSSRILMRHVLRNAMSPLITMMGYQLPVLVSGSALIEIITGWPGLGRLMLQAVQSQDVFLVMANVMMVSVLLIVGNALADCVLGMVDPRVHVR